MDKRKKYILLVDVETAGGLNKPLVYDLGFAIVDKQGNIHDSESFIISQIFDNKKLMNSAYYAEKIPLYLEGLENATFSKVTWETAISKLNQMAVKWQAQTIGAYNLAFDKRAMTNTHSVLGWEGKLLDKRLKGIEQMCVMGLACQTIFKQKTYGLTAVQNGWVSEAGNYRTTAECAYRYITGDYEFEEAHTGLADVKIEAEIMAYSLRQKKKYIKGIIEQAWRIPNSR